MNNERIPKVTLWKKKGKFDSTAMSNGKTIVLKYPSSNNLSFFQEQNMYYLHKKFQNLKQ